MIAFAGNPLDRASDKRSDSAWLAAARANGRTKVLPLWKLQPLLLGPEGSTQATELGFIDGTLATGLGAADANEVFLGVDGESAFFARDISALADPLAAALAGLGHFRDARSAAALLPLHHVAIMGQAKALIDWHDRHRFCAQCGAATSSADGGYKRVCSSCNAEHFPRTDHAGYRGRSLSLGSKQALCGGTLLDARWLRRTGRNHRGGGQARSVRGSRPASEQSALLRHPALAVSVQFDDRLLCRGRYA